MYNCVLSPKTMNNSNDLMRTLLNNFVCSGFPCLWAKFVGPVELLGIEKQQKSVLGSPNWPENEAKWLLQCDNYICLLVIQMCAYLGL